MTSYQPEVHQKPNGRWHAVITRPGVTIGCGTHTTLAAAEKAARDAVLLYELSDKEPSHAPTKC